MLQSSPSNTHTHIHTLGHTDITQPSLPAPEPRHSTPTPPKARQTSRDEPHTFPTPPHIPGSFTQPERKVRPALFVYYLQVYVGEAREGGREGGMNVKEYDRMGR